MNIDGNSNERMDHDDDLSRPTSNNNEATESSKDTQDNDEAQPSNSDNAVIPAARSEIEVATQPEQAHGILGALALSSSSNHNISSLGNPAYPPTPAQLVPVSSIDFLPSSYNQTYVSSITSAFEDADFFVSSLYPSTQAINEAAEEQQEEPPALSGLRVPRHSTNSIPKTETLPVMEANITQLIETLPALEANVFRKIASAGKGEMAGHPTSFVKATPTIETIHKKENPEEAEELGRTELPIFKPQAGIIPPASSYPEEDDVLVGIMPLPSSGRTTGEESRGPGAHPISTPARGWRSENNTFGRMMALPGRRTTRGQPTPRGPGAHAITTPARVWRPEETTEYAHSLESEESKEDTEYNNNNVGLAEAQPIDALPEAQLEDGWAEQQKQMTQGSFLGFIARLPWYCRFLLMISSSAIMAGWFVFIMRKYIWVGDPAMIRIRQSIEEVFGDNYFDCHLKEKALHWIVYEDPLKDLAVKQQDQQQETAETTTRLIQRFSLVAFYFQTSARQPWTYCNPPQGKQSDVCFYRVPRGKTENRAARWLSAAHECQWMGVYCEGGSKTVSTLALSNQNMTGHIPFELSKFSNIKKLDLSQNSLSGSLPLWISQLPVIDDLLLQNNFFTGHIPPNFFSISSLSRLFLTSNLLSGQLPSQIGLFRGHYLSLGENKFIGSIPDQTYRLSNLQFLHLHQNMLTGSISTLVGHLTKLRLLEMKNCDLDGTVPSQVGLLQSLEYLNISTTKLHGTIPEDLYNLRPMRRLDISDNQFGGTISSRIGQLAGLEEFSLANTGISGTIPEHISLLSKLRVFHANGNPKLTGSVPMKFCTNKYQHHDFVFDCSPSSSTGVPAVLCPKGCCSACCDVETKICMEQ